MTNFLSLFRTVSCGLLVLIFPFKAVSEIEPNTPAFECYEVHAISSVMRLPNSLSADAKRSSVLKIVAAQGEYEPTSFIVVPKINVEKLELKTTGLKGEGGEIPEANIDFKIVKCWYQGGTGWYSYFGDSNRRELIPELLLNDETLVKVDHERKDNYLRVGDEYRWISYPKQEAKEAFNYLTEPVADSDVLQPIRLITGENKQIWITVLVPENAKAGIYRGQIQMIADGNQAGAMELQVRVLPFKLPMPKTYYDLEQDYMVTLYRTGILENAKSFGIPQEDANRKQMAIFENLLKHNVFNCRASITYSHKQKDRAEALEEIRNEIRLMKAAGFITKPFLSNIWGYYASEAEKTNREVFRSRIREFLKVMQEELGHDDIYITSMDEANREQTRHIRELAETINSEGAKLWITTANGQHFNLAGYAVAYANESGWPTRDQAARWHAIGSKIASYAGPHSGIENPDVFRRWEGLGRYKANYDGCFNYKYFDALHPVLWKKQKRNIWNDFLATKFRQMNFVYPVADGVIDTLAWEGFREGIDDIRYATKLKQEAQIAIASGKTEAVHTAKKALMWLELTDETTVDLNTLRQEMIEHILKIQATLNP